MIHSVVVAAIVLITPMFTGACLLILQSKELFLAFLNLICICLQHAFNNSCFHVGGMLDVELLSIFRLDLSQWQTFYASLCLPQKPFCSSVLSLFSKFQTSHRFREGVDF